MSCVLEFGFQFNSSACPPSFFANYQTFSIMHVIIFSLLFALSIYSFSIRCIKAKMKINLKDPYLVINFLSMAISICYMIHYSNYYGIHWGNDFCVTGISVDAGVSLLFILGFYLIEVSEEAMFLDGIISPPVTNREAIFYYIRYVFVTFLKILFLIISFLPGVMICNNMSNAEVMNTWQGFKLAVELTGCSYFIFNLTIWISKLNLKIIETQNKVKQANQMTLGRRVSLSKEESSIRIWTQMKNTFLMALLSIVLVFIIFFVFNCIPLISNKYYFIATLSSTPELLFVKPELSSYLVMFILSLLIYNSFDRNRKLEFSAGVSIGLYLVFIIWGSVTLTTAILIYNEHFALISLLFYTISTVVGIICILLSPLIITRDEELLACINFTAGKVLKWWHFIFPLLEILSLIFVSLDSLFLWWSPPWYLSLAVVLFNGVSASEVDYLAYIMPNIPPSVITNMLLWFLCTLVFLLTSTKFIRFPKLFMSVLNFVSLLTYDILIMGFASLLIRKLKCHDVNNGKNFDSDSTLQNFGILEGYPEMSCDNANVRYILTFIWMYISIFVGILTYGVSYVILVRNKTSHPTIWEIPGFVALKTFMKFTIVCVINMTQKNNFYSPWIRSTTNCICCFTLALFHYIVSPCLGPQSDIVNLYRTTGYSFAAFCSFVSLLSLIILQIFGSNSVVGGYVISVLTLLVPVIGSSYVYVVTKKRKSKSLAAIGKVVNLVTSKQVTLRSLMMEYKLSLRFKSSGINGYSFLPALALNIPESILHNQLTQILAFCVENISSSSSAMILNFLNDENVGHAFLLLQVASERKEAVRIIKAKYLSVIIKILNESSIDKLLREKKNDLISKFTNGGDEKKSETAEENIELRLFTRNLIVPLFSKLVNACLIILCAICKQSKFYLIEVVSKNTDLIALIVKQHNFLVYFLQHINGNKAFGKSTVAGSEEEIHSMLSFIDSHHDLLNILFQAETIVDDSKLFSLALRENEIDIALHKQTILEVFSLVDHPEQIITQDLEAEQRSNVSPTHANSMIKIKLQANRIGGSKNSSNYSNRNSANRNASKNSRGSGNLSSVIQNILPGLHLPKRESKIDFAFHQNLSQMHSRSLNSSGVIILFDEKGLRLNRMHFIECINSYVGAYNITPTRVEKKENSILNISTRVSTATNITDILRISSVKDPFARRPTAKDKFQSNAVSPIGTKTRRGTLLAMKDFTGKATENIKNTFSTLRAIRKIDRKDKMIVVIGSCEKIDQKAKDSFMMEWRSSSNELRNKVDLIIDIEGALLENNNNEEREGGEYKSILKEDKSIISFSIEQKREYLKYLSDLIRKELEERKRRMEMFKLKL